MHIGTSESDLLIGLVLRIGPWNIFQSLRYNSELVTLVW